MTRRHHQNRVGPSDHRHNSKFWLVPARRLAKLSWRRNASAMLFRIQLNLNSLLKNLLKRNLKRNRQSKTLRSRRK